MALTKAQTVGSGAVRVEARVSGCGVPGCSTAAPAGPARLSHRCVLGAPARDSGRLVAASFCVSQRREGGGAPVLNRVGPRCGQTSWSSEHAMQPDAWPGFPPLPDFQLSACARSTRAYLFLRQSRNVEHVTPVKQSLPGPPISGHHDAPLRLPRRSRDRRQLARLCPHAAWHTPRRRCSPPREGAGKQQVGAGGHLHLQPPTAVSHRAIETATPGLNSRPSNDR